MSRGDIRFSSSERSAGSVPGEDHIHLTFFLGIASPLPPVPEFSARQVVGADVLPGLRWMLAPAAVAGHRLASGLRLLLRLLRPLHERLGAVPEVRLPPRRPGPFHWRGPCPAEGCLGLQHGRLQVALISDLDKWEPIDSHGKVDQNPGSRYCHIHSLHPRGRE